MYAPVPVRRQIAIFVEWTETHLQACIIIMTISILNSIEIVIYFY